MLHVLYVDLQQKANSTLSAREDVLISFDLGTPGIDRLTNHHSPRTLPLPKVTIGRDTAFGRTKIITNTQKTAPEPTLRSFHLYQQRNLGSRRHKLRRKGDQNRRARPLERPKIQNQTKTTINNLPAALAALKHHPPLPLLLDPQQPSRIRSPPRGYHLLNISLLLLYRPSRSLLIEIQCVLYLCTPHIATVKEYSFTSIEIICIDNKRLQRFKFDSLSANSIHSRVHTAEDLGKI